MKVVKIITYIDQHEPYMRNEIDAHVSVEALQVGIVQYNRTAVFPERTVRL